MRRKILVALSIIIIALPVFAQNSISRSNAEGLFAEMEVGQKKIVLDLYFDKSPVTVMNFVGLATGAFDSQIGRKGKYYDGLSFHRVVEDFVVQGGDPLGNGQGGPGYTFPDEFDTSLLFNSRGILAMANRGPGTNGSQFFITLAETPFLNGRHTIFGKVVSGMDAVYRIKQGETISSVKIIAKGESAKQFLNTVSWEKFQDAISKINR